MTPSRETPSQHAARVRARCLHIVETLERVQKRNLATRRENQARLARLHTVRDDVDQGEAGFAS